VTSGWKAELTTRLEELAAVESPDPRYVTGIRLE
jgi:hypothetical protein